MLSILIFQSPNSTRHPLGTCWSGLPEEQVSYLQTFMSILTFKCNPQLYNHLLDLSLFQFLLKQAHSGGTPCFSPSCVLSHSPSTLSPFLHVSSRYLESCFSRNPQWPHLPETQIHSLLINSQLPHSSKNRRGPQKQENGMPTQQRQSHM